MTLTFCTLLVASHVESSIITGLLLLLVELTVMQHEQLVIPSPVHLHALESKSDALLVVFCLVPLLRAVV